MLEQPTEQNIKEIMEREGAVGILLKGMPYDAAYPWNSLGWLWYTKPEFEQMLDERNNGDEKLYWQRDRVFSIDDIAIARPFSLLDLRRHDVTERTQPVLYENLKQEALAIYGQEGSIGTQGEKPILTSGE